MSNNDDVQFARGAARRPAPVVQDPVMQWATGLLTASRTIYAGWLVETGKHNDLDYAMGECNCEQVTIKHGTGSLVRHWAIPTASMFVIADGVQSIGEMKHTRDRLGIAFGWRTLEGGRMQSVLRCRVLLPQLLHVGYTDPLLLTLKSTLTGDFLAALMMQFDVLQAIAAFRAESNKPPMDLPFYACAIPIGPGEEVARGSGGQSRDISPPVAKIPNPVTREYVKQQWIKREWLSLIEGRIEDTIRWSIENSATISAGERDPAQEDYS